MLIKRSAALLVIALSIILLFQTLKADNIDTTLSIAGENFAPILTQNIPNQTWAINTNITNAFDLDNYFIDNESLTYNYTLVNNITIIINGTTNLVSFYPDYNFEGIRNVTFNAKDSSGLEKDSNLVTLNVTNDTLPPTWSSPSKDKADSQIFQNSVVTFTTSWGDNIGLDHFIFSIKQESGWINQSPAIFTGKQNTSSFTIQISAPANTLVLWEFYGFDTSGNMNITEESNFTVSQTSSTTTPGAGAEEEEESSSITSTKDATKTTKIKANFSISPEGAFKLDIKQGSIKTIVIKITNIGNIDMPFEINVTGLYKIKVRISNPSFNLSAGNSRTVTIEFDIDETTPPDIYYGKIRIKSTSETRDIPIVIIIKPIELEFDLAVNISDEYKSVRPNSIVKANITLTNLKDVKERNVSLYYAVTDFKGEIINSGFDQFTFSQNTLTMQKELSIPEKIKRGEYIFLVRALSDDNIVIGSDVFEVVERFNVAGFIKANFIILLIILSSITVALIMLRYYKDKEKLRILNLYLMINELNKLVKEGKHDEAIEIFIRIKSFYGEPISKSSLENKDELRKEMEKLTEELNNKVLKKMQIENLGKTEDNTNKEKSKENNEEKTDKESKTEEKKQEDKESKGEEKVEDKKQEEGEKTDKESPEEELEEKKDKKKEKDKRKIKEKDKVTDHVIEKIKKAFETKPERSNPKKEKNDK